MSTQPSFIFVTCQPGAESTLKKELAREHPELKFAYSRPGFVTFKRSESPTGTADTPDFSLKSVFARTFGLSLEKLAWKEGQEGADERAKKVVERFVTSGASQLHVWERDRFPPGEEPKGFQPGDWLRSATAKIESEVRVRGLKIPLNGRAAQGEKVLDLVLVEDQEWWVGLHQHGPQHSAFAGGRPPIEVPDEAPSRAFLKLEEALAWSGAPLKAGDVAVDVGSAPGGATYALLKRGLKVVGVDPGEMDPKILRSRSFQHIQRPIAAVYRDELPESVQWLVLDMNVAPSVSLFAIDRLAVGMKDSLLGLLLTVKLNKWEYAEQIPSMIEHVRSMGMVKARATQLASNGQEFFIYGVTPKGSTRR